MTTDTTNTTSSPVSSPTTNNTRRNRRHSTFVVATSVRNGTVTKTTAVERYSDDTTEQIQSLWFHQRLYASLVLQYTSILIMASPFALIIEVQQYLLDHESLNSALEIVAISGIIITMAAAICIGSKYPYAHICLVSITIFVGLEMGLSFASTPIMYIAIGQATTSFALLLAIMQFHFKWLDYPMAVILCFIAASFWMMILLETNNYSLVTSLIICGGGFVFVCMVLCASYHVEHFVGPDEYVLATLFILCPEALLCIGGSSKRNIPDETAAAFTEEGELLLKEEIEDTAVP
jgi:hypothetical protein